MFLEKISVLNFKNIAEVELCFSANVNCLVGDNGTGKTNLIDAVWYLSMSKSAVGLTDGQSVRHGEDFFMLNGQYSLRGGEGRENVVCSFKRGAGKVIRRNGKEYDRVTEHIGLLPIVMVSPGDTALIHESGDERRRFLNSFLSQTDREYLHAMVRYNHLLAERNRLLKTGAVGFEEVMEVLDMQLAEVGTVVHGKRAEMIGRLAPKVGEYYAILSSDREAVEITYKSDLTEADFAGLLAASRERDRACGFTNCGIHRDDMKLEILGYPIRKYGSQGQQKSMLLALKLAQFDIIRELRGVKPILLLDDVFDKLDLSRVEQLIGMVSSDRFGQIFITDSNKVRLEGILAKLTENYKLFGVADGVIEELSTDGAEDVSTGVTPEGVAMDMK